MTKHEEKVRQLKKRMLQISYRNQQGYLPSSFSIIDILVSLYYEVMQYDVQGRFIDEFVLSKGHAALALYVVLEDKNVLKSSELEKWGKYNSQLCLMAERKRPGILFSTGSLGHGLPEAVGLAYAKKICKEEGRVFVLIGDGELEEGSNWEAFQAAIKMKLDNLVCIIDYNRSSLSPIMKEWNSIQILKMSDCCVEKMRGHDEYSLWKVLNKSENRIMVIIADTVKGKGCSVMELNPAFWHSKAPSEQEYISMLEEVQ